MLSEIRILYSGHNDFLILNLYSAKTLFLYGLQIVLTIAEHHSAIVPWQLLSEKTGAVLKFVSLTEEEVPDIKMLQELVSKKTKLVVVHHVSNMLGTYYPCLFMMDGHVDT